MRIEITELEPNYELFLIKILKNFIIKKPSPENSNFCRLNRKK